MKVLMFVVAMVSVLGVSLAGIWFLSARTAENGCTFAAEERGFSSVVIEWSWVPLGTTCTFDDRVSETRILW